MNHKLTFITGMFIGNSPHSKYSNYFNQTLRNCAIAQPMIIFCDETYVKKFQDVRNALGYKNISLVISLNIEQLYFYKFKAYIDKCYKHSPGDNKINATTTLIQLSKFELVYRGIKLNPFNTTHFSWIDVNLLSKYFNNSTNYFEPFIYDKLNAIAENPKDKMTVQLINCWTPQEYECLSQFGKEYRWIVAGGFYTIDVDTALFLLPKFIQQAEDLIHQRFIQNDECIFAFMIDKYEDRFNYVLGDYQDSIYNYYKIEKNMGHCNFVIQQHLVKGVKERIRACLSQYKENGCLEFEYYLRQLNTEC